VRWTNLFVVYLTLGAVVKVVGVLWHSLGRLGLYSVVLCEYVLYKKGVSSVDVRRMSQDVTSILVTSIVTLSREHSLTQR
jgi:hypothetical protein